MLETPLFGRFQGENKRLVFSAPSMYHTLIRGCWGAGAFGVLFGLSTPALGVEAPFYPAWWVGTGVLVALAATAASFSLASISFDLKERHYRRRQGPGLFPKLTTGSISSLDALVLISEPRPQVIAGGVTYHLVLHWKSQAEPPMVLQQDTRSIPPGQPLNMGAQQLLQLGLRYAQSIGIPFFDNSHFASKCPVPIW